MGREYFRLAYSQGDWVFSVLFFISLLQCCIFWMIMHCTGFERLPTYSHSFEWAVDIAMTLRWVFLLHR